MRNAGTKTAKSKEELESFSNNIEVIEMDVADDDTDPALKSWRCGVSRFLNYTPEDDKISHESWCGNDQSMNILSGQKR